MRSARSLIRPIIRKLDAYVPGEQPKIPGLIKLNTNENPYGPSPRVLRAIQAATDARLRLYPNPTSQPLREALAKFHGCRPENVVVGNGSDELLALATRAFVEPLDAIGHGNSGGPASARASTVQFFVPSYSLYPVLAKMHGSVVSAIPLRPDFSLPSVRELRREGRWNFGAALTFITTPNAPSGRGYSTKDLEEVCRAQRGVVVLDEAYVDFASENALNLALKYPHVLVSRTFSKAYSLCFLRVGYFIGHPELIAALDKIRDSYNVNGLGQIAAVATLDDPAYYRRNFQRVIATRKRVSERLAELGFSVFPSETNFVLVRPPERFPAQEWLELLRRRKILVRWFSSPECADYLRITIGSDREMTTFLRAVEEGMAH